MKSEVRFVIFEDVLPSIKYSPGGVINRKIRVLVDEMIAFNDYLIASLSASQYVTFIQSGEEPAAALEKLFGNRLPKLTKTGNNGRGVMNNELQIVHLLSNDFEPSFLTEIS